VFRKVYFLNREEGRVSSLKKMVMGGEESVESRSYYEEGGRKEDHFA